MSVLTHCQVDMPSTQDNSFEWNPIFCSDKVSLICQSPCRSLSGSTSIEVMVTCLSVTSIPRDLIGLIPITSSFAWAWVISFPFGPSPVQQAKSNSVDTHCAPSSYRLLVRRVLERTSRPESMPLHSITASWSSTMMKPSLTHHVP